MSRFSSNTPVKKNCRREKEAFNPACWFFRGHYEKWDNELNRSLAWSIRAVRMYLWFCSHMASWELRATICFLNPFFSDYAISQLGKTRQFHLFEVKALSLQEAVEAFATFVFESGSFWPVFWPGQWAVWECCSWAVLSTCRGCSLSETISVCILTWRLGQFL